MKRRKHGHIRSFRRLLAGHLCAGLAVSAVFAGGLFEYGRNYIFRQAQDRMQDHHSNIQSTMASPDADTGRLNMMLRVGASYAVLLPGPFDMVSDLRQGCAAVHLVCDENGRILWSGERALMALIKDDDEAYRGFMLCDPGSTVIGELDAADAVYAAYCAQADADTYPRVTLDSAWVNGQEQRFIPRSFTISLMHSRSGDVLGEEEVLEEQHFNIPDPGWDGYVLKEFVQGDIHVSPRASIVGYQGTAPEVYAAILEEPYVTELMRDDAAGGTGGFWGGSSTSNYYYSRSPIYVDGKAYRLLSICHIEAWNEQTKPLYFALVAAFTVLSLIIAAVAARMRYLRDKADADFLAYQRALTNDLAHDLKTPLMAIGGYAENAREHPGEAGRYLQGILDNVAYTDTIINRTLELGQLDSLREIRHEAVELQPLLRSLLDKYELLLDEREIGTEIAGDGTIRTDPHLLGMILDNLVSNAVQHTPHGGTIRVELSGRACDIFNTVERIVETQELKHPFRKGDTARTGRSGSGLGLSIADTACTACGFTLTLSCTDTQFTAHLRF